jgi:zinc/manganese transport system ATP-binding protein
MDRRQPGCGGKSAGRCGLVNAVDFERVTVRLGDRPVLADVSFAVRPGEFIGVLGPNGSGKTTLMRAILGLVAPASGRISLFGRPAARGDASVGYMPQVRRLPAALRLNGRDFLAAGYDGHRWGLPRLSVEGARQIDASLARVGAADLARRPLAQLSGGERQRLLLAQAIIGNPKLVLLDEPLISLDPRQQMRVIDIARRLAREDGATVLFSAHDLNPLVEAMDRVLYLGGGQAVLGSVAEVVRADVLSRLYGTDIEILEAGGRIFVMTGGHFLEDASHGHDHHV